MTKGTPQIAALKRSFALLDAVITGDRSLAEVAANLGLPLSTAYRQITTLTAEGYLLRLANGRYVGGPRLLRLLGSVDDKQIVANAAAPALGRLAARIGAIVQLGTLDNDMVTYRIKVGQGAARLFTKVGMQMEAYCTAIGKVLLAQMPEHELEAYLANGPFVALTSRTIVSPDHLREELARVRREGFAVDDGEAADDLYCLAVPVRSASGQVRAAVSLSRDSKTAERQGHGVALEALRGTAAEIERTLSGET